MENKADYLSLEKIRAALGLSKGDFAEKLGDTQNHYSRLLENERIGKLNKTKKLLSLALYREIKPNAEHFLVDNRLGNLVISKKGEPLVYVSDAMMLWLK